ncbi:MAG: hypothetical protein R2911_10830 [Caldilineaceae bacterium]
MMSSFSSLMLRPVVAACFAKVCWALVPWTSTVMMAVPPSEPVAEAFAVDARHQLGGHHFLLPFEGGNGRFAGPIDRPLVGQRGIGGAPGSWQCGRKWAAERRQKASNRAWRP